MNFFFVLCVALWSRTLNYIAALLVRNNSYSPYNPRSLLSLVIELTSIITFLYAPTLFHPPYLPALLLFFSALFITMHTDAQTMLISRFVTIYLVPVGWCAAFLGLLPLSPLQSIMGSFMGLLLLWITAKVSLMLMKKEGLGQGDIDLLCFIGSFTGPLGCWISLLIGSISGTLVGLFYIILMRKKENVRLPFGIFLSTGALTFLLFQERLFRLFF